MQEIELNGESRNITKDNIDKLKQIFPEVFNENKIDFDKLQAVLGENIDTEDEKYRFTWNGKMNALRLSQTPSTGTLRPCKADSVEWDTTQNLYIEGDNLEVLKLLQNSYLNKIKMIYIDPPYNTGNDFVYKDDFKDNIENYKKITGQIDGDGNAVSTNSDSSGRYHTNWLNMMYPRLRLAKNLLTQNGVLFISIDDHEIDNLIKICNEIFGEKFVDKMIWRKSGVGRDGKMKNTTTFRKDHEYIIVCFNSELLLNKSFEKPDWENEYGNPDNDPRGGYKAGSISKKEEASNPNHANYYTVTSPTGKQFTRQFDVSKAEFEKLNADNRIFWGMNGDAVPAVKIFQNEKRYVTTSSYLIEKDNYISASSIDEHDSTTTKGSKELEEILNIEGIGAEMRPKPTDLLTKLLQIGSNSEDIVLDFFSGSGTTAHSCYKINIEKNEHRRFIMVQLPENSPKGSVASKAQYETICEIGKERIRRAGKQIKEEKTDKDIDTGFKVFKLDSSNIKKWNPDTKDLEKSLFDQVNNFIDGRTEEDILYEIILKCGLDLTVPVEELNIQDKKVYSVGMGALIVCLDNDITLEVANEIAKLDTVFEDKQNVTVVFKDNGFKDDSVKTNIKETIRGYGIGKFVTI